MLRQKQSMKKFYFLFCLLLGWMPFSSVSAQTVSGKLVDETGQPLPFANVVLLSLPDSAFVAEQSAAKTVPFHYRPREKTK